MKHLLAWSLFLLAALTAQAQVSGDAAERERIKAERAAVQARYAEGEKACRAKFAVNDCVDQVTRERNARLSELRRQERLLNEADRKRRAAERLKQIEERQSPERQKAAAERRAQAMAEQKAREEAASEKAARRAADQAARAERGPRVKAPRGAPQPQGTPRTPAPSGSNAPTPEEAAKNRAAYEARLQAAERHRAEVAARVAKRAKPPASALPVPK